MTEQMKRNGVEEQLTENQRAVQAKLKKVIKKVGGIPREVAESTIHNFLTVFREDENFADLRFNVLSSRPERVSADGRREWTASDDAWSRGYIEEVYEIHSQSKWQDAFIQMQGERAYNPAQDIVGSIQWDGKSRCESFLIDWMGVEDTPYNREVSRLIFAGGINRLYDPGCKFDCVPVLIGAQGGGKSTICHWLALEDEFYSSINTIEGQKGAEGIQGVWVCEIEELLAILANDKAGSAREEKAKAFISKQDEYYRQPYTKRPVHHPRQCIFIGTTNRDTFLTDKTGARRWFPVKVHSVAQDLYDHEAECKEAIRQAWAEMKVAYDNHEAFASPAPSTILDEEIKAQQADAACEDWRVGVIETYLRDKTSVCLLQIWYEALGAFKSGSMTQKDSRELAEILVKQLGWERGNVKNFGGVYSKQKSFNRPKAASARTVA